jgi:hypothetical protein
MALSAAALRARMAESDAARALESRRARAVLSASPCARATLASVAPRMSAVAIRRAAQGEGTIRMPRRR